MLARTRGNQVAVEHNAAVSSAANYFSWLNISAFANNFRYGTESGRAFGVSLMRYFFLPLSAVVSVFGAVFAWREAKIERYQGISVPRALVESVAAVATIAAAATAVVLTGALAFVGPVILAGAIGLRSVFKAAEAIFYGVKAARADNVVERSDYKSRAAIAGTEAVVGAVIAAGLVVAQVFAGPVVQAVAWVSGIVASIVGYAVMRSRADTLSDYQRSGQFDRDCETLERVEEQRVTSTARLAQEFGQASLEQPISPPEYQAPPPGMEQQQASQMYPALEASNGVAYPPTVRYGT